VLIERLTAQYADHPDLLSHAIPNYPPGAKRMLRDNGVWAAALKSEHTTVVTAGIDRFSERGIIDNEGVEHEVDIVVFATGFQPSDYLDEVEVMGRDGVEIHDFWKGDARAYNGIAVPGFPNFFLIYGPNVGGVVAGSLHFMIERAVEYSLKCVHEVLQRSVAAIDVKPAALNRFVDWVDAGNRRMAWGQPYVQSWYQNSHGRVSQVWPYTNAEYWEVTESVSEIDHEFIA
jgi:4-hydroxyacetophenone monooxygenase